MNNLDYNGDILGNSGSRTMGSEVNCVGGMLYNVLLQNRVC